MAERIDELFADWHRLGGAVLLAEAPETGDVPMPELLIAESTAHCRDSSRLMWVVMDWLSGHADQVDAERVLNLTRLHGDLAVLGLICDMVLESEDSTVLRNIRASCRPHPNREIFFHRVARSQLASSLAEEHPLEIYQRWNFLGRELVRLGA